LIIHFLFLFFPSEHSQKEHEGVLAWSTGLNHRIGQTLEVSAVHLHLVKADLVTNLRVDAELAKRTSLTGL